MFLLRLALHLSLLYLYLLSLLAPALVNHVLILNQEGAVGQEVEYQEVVGYLEVAVAGQEVEVYLEVEVVYLDLVGYLEVGVAVVEEVVGFLVVEEVLDQVVAEVVEGVEEVAEYLGLVEYQEVEEGQEEHRYSVRRAQTAN
jgi:hypothetical protein